MGEANNEFVKKSDEIKISITENPIPHLLKEIFSIALTVINVLPPNGHALLYLSTKL